MQDARIEGMGSIHGGEYKDIFVDGMGKLKGDIKADKIAVSGMFKSNGEISANELICDGLSRVFKNVKVKKATVSGVLKIRRAKLEANNIKCDGVITCTREVCADEIYIDGVCSISKMYGDKIIINNKLGGLANSKIPTKFLMLTNIYLGRKISMSHSLVDLIECTNLEASGLKAKIVKAQNVTLHNNCIIDRLECTGQVVIDDSCKIGNIPSNNKGADSMANMSIIKILELYKNGKINEEEAEKMISSASNRNTETTEETLNVRLEDDEKVRIVVFKGRRLLKKGEARQYNINVEYQGDVLNVECDGNLKCGNVDNNVNAGESITCGDIKGNVKAGNGIECGAIDGNVDAGNSVTCGDVGGNVKSGSRVNCNSVNGDVNAGGSISMKK